MSELITCPLPPLSFDSVDCRLATIPAFSLPETADRGAGSHLEISDISSKSAFHAMTILGYNSHIADALLDRAARFRQAVARQVPIRRLRRPLGRWTLDELVERVTSEERI